MVHHIFSFMTVNTRTFIGHEPVDLLLCKAWYSMEGWMISYWSYHDSFFFANSILSETYMALSKCNCTARGLPSSHEYHLSVELFIDSVEIA